VLGDGERDRVRCARRVREDVVVVVAATAAGTVVGSSVARYGVKKLVTFSKRVPNAVAAWATVPCTTTPRVLTCSIDSPVPRSQAVTASIRCRVGPKRARVWAGVR
jgi:hypothetical protein